MDKKQNLLLFSLGILALAVVFIAYSNHWHNPFHFDDAHTIETNSYIRHLDSIPAFFKTSQAFSSLPQNQSYRPLVTTSLAIDYWLATKADATNGLNPFFYHITNFFTFLVQCILLFFIFLKLMNLAKPHRWNAFIALFAATLYGVHTANAETVNYIIARTDIISTFAIVVSFFLYLYSPFCKKTYLYLLPVCIGIFAKESAAIFPLLLFVYIFLFESNETFTKANILRSIKKIIPALIACALLIIYVFGKAVNWQPGGVDRFTYLITETFVMVHYFNTFFLPFTLSADTDWKAIPNVFDDRVIVGLIFILGMLFIAYKCALRKETKPITFGILWFFFALAPTSTLLPFAEVLNDHRIYFPYIGLLLSVVWSIGLFIINRENKIMANSAFGIGVIAFAFLIICAHAYGTHTRNNVWSSEESLWKDVTIKSPENGRGLMNYGLVKMGQGKYDEAMSLYTRALVYLPYYAFLHTNLAILNGAMGNDAEAERYFKSAITYGPQYPDCYYFYTVWLSGKGRIPEAIQNCETALRLSPGHTNANTLLASLQNNPNLKNMKTPLQNAEDLAKTTPTPDNYLNLSLQYYLVKRYPECIQASREALKLKSDFPEAYNNICSAYNSMGKYDSAIIAGTHALKIRPDYQLAKNNLNYAKQMLRK